jgi:hypothetical protein
LVRRFDGEFPKRFFKEFLAYIDTGEPRFHSLIDQARSPHLWDKTDAGWRLRHQVA